MENYVYLFLFGDNQSSVQTSNNSVAHSYSVSGIYQASVTIQSFGTIVYLETVIVIQGRVRKSKVTSYIHACVHTIAAIIKS